MMSMVTNILISYVREVPQCWEITMVLCGEKVIEMLNECGTVTGLFHEYELKLAELVKQYMPSIDMFRILGTGTEADMAAIRLARYVYWQEQNH